VAGVAFATGLLGQPAFGRSASGSTRALGFNSGDLIEACRRSQHRADLRYEKALKLEWPDALEVALEAQHDRVHAARQELSAIEY